MGLKEKALRDRKAKGTPLRKKNGRHDQTVSSGMALPKNGGTTIGRQSRANSREEGRRLYLKERVLKHNRRVTYN